MQSLIVGAERAKPFTPAEAPVSRMVPRPRGIMQRAACCATRKAPKAVTSRLRRTSAGSRSVIGPRMR